MKETNPHRRPPDPSGVGLVHEVKHNPFPHRVVRSDVGGQGTPSFRPPYGIGEHVGVVRLEF